MFLNGNLSIKYSWFVQVPTLPVVAASAKFSIFEFYSQIGFLFAVKAMAAAASNTSSKQPDFIWVYHREIECTCLRGCFVLKVHSDRVVGPFMNIPKVFLGLVLRPKIHVVSPLQVTIFHFYFLWKKVKKLIIWSENQDVFLLLGQEYLLLETF